MTGRPLLLASTCVRVGPKVPTVGLRGAVRLENHAEGDEVHVVGFKEGATQILAVLLHETPSQIGLHLKEWDFVFGQQVGASGREISVIIR